MYGSTIAKLGAIAAEHWGMFTTAEASGAGVARKTLSGLATSGAVERVAQGVYRVAGAPAAALEIDSIRVHWLAVGGAATADGARAIVAAGTTAAALHEVGDWMPGVTDFVSLTRRTTRLPGVRLRTRQLSADDIIHVDGLPTMTVERMIADLVESREDLSLVSRALADAAWRGNLTQPRRLPGLLDSLAHRNGYTSGHAFANDLLRSAGLDPEDVGVGRS
ncbi:type IV toxin-antitoxin system AbiEi family antitoxin domain-containing protein [Microbacterium sp.]|uniref:type IV toxin-antitoxin system AbiEi family antitoxin domain-containing protein n=1 Tax=Microbacterium sp. TaxID=51671 RepID=UPI003A8883B1